MAEFDHKSRMQKNYAKSGRVGMYVPGNKEANELSQRYHWILVSGSQLTWSAVEWSQLHQT